LRTTLRTPRGHLVNIVTRDDTADLSIVHGMYLSDEYGLRDLPPDLEGWALDIGSHIGSIAIALALDYSRLRVIAVEPLPENVEVIRENVAANGLEERVRVEHAALTTFDGMTVVYGDYKTIVGMDAAYVRDNRYIGGMSRGENEATAYDVRAVTLSTLLADIDEVAFTKTDCEGCEWAMFADPAVVKLRYIVGEYHDGTENTVASALLATHELTTMPAGMEGDSGIGLFGAERRA
jgi:FkbM family methyltransferase